MNPHLYLTMPLFFMIITIILNHASISVSANEQYENCSMLFKCANEYIDYPFWGANRPSYCGYPGFKLDCEGETPEIKIMSERYRVLEINTVSQTLKVARADYLYNICPTFLVNTTLNLTLFNYTSDTQNVTLYYGCPTTPNPILTIGISSQFNCIINDTNIIDYYVTRNLTTSALVNIANAINNALGSCNDSVIIPAFQSSVQFLESNPTSTDLIAALDDGFGLQWTANDTFCDPCKRSGGQCGHDPSSNEFSCYCPDKPYALTCPIHKFSAGLAIGVVFGIFLVWWLLVIIQRRRKKAAQSTPSSNFDLEKKSTNFGTHNFEAFIKSYGTLTPKRYSYLDVKKMTKSFIDKLGQGGYGSVYKGKLSDGRPIAVKILSELKGNGEEFINEVASISRTSHVNIVTLVGFCYERTKRALIYEFMPNRSLDKFIYDQESSHTCRNLQWETLYQIAIGIGRGLEYLHRGCNIRIVHFDIKPHNILLDEDFCPKISDFGLAKLCKRKESIVSMMGARGTAGYIAPEVFCRSFGGVSHKSDVYSYGMMVLEMVGGRKNINVGVSNTSEIYFPQWIYKQLEPGNDLKLHGDITEQEGETARKMIIVSLWCIQINPSDRPSMTKVIEMLEGSLHSLQIPPMPTLSSPRKSPQHSSTPSSSSL